MLEGDKGRDTHIGLCFQYMLYLTPILDSLQHSLLLLYNVLMLLRLW